MKHKIIFLLVSILIAFAVGAQTVLPEITVKNINGKIIVSWLNDYTKPIATINIQRSYDSLKNYNSIGSVLNPQNKENGYADASAPYSKMYYRLFIAFEGGSYVITKAVRPVKQIPVPEVIKTAEGKDSVVTPEDRFPWISNVPDSSTVTAPVVNNKPVITYPSKNVYTARDNGIVIHLTGATVRKYHIKFFDENDQMIFELNKLTEDVLILEKVNFGHSGWYHFELYEDGELVEKNKFFVPKDPKKPNG